MGGKHAGFSHHSFRELENLQLLADVTQQLYLGLPSFDEELMQKSEHRIVSRAKKRR